jgi:hypothetical protein
MDRGVLSGPACGGVHPDIASGLHANIRLKVNDFTRAFGRDCSDDGIHRVTLTAIIDHDP